MQNPAEPELYQAQPLTCILMERGFREVDAAVDSARRMLARWIAILVFGLAGLVCVFGVAPGSLVADEPAPPNVVLIVMDDADWSLFERDFDPAFGFRYFPNIGRLADEGMRFTNFHVTTPICGPSRACLLTGRYAHQNGIRCNEPELRNSRGLGGGYEVWTSRGPNGMAAPSWAQSHLGTWMQAAGYRTMLVGKYLHSGFIPGPGQNWSDLRPAGWDDSWISLGGDYYGTTQLINGSIRTISALNAPAYPSNYRTDVEARDALRLIEDQASLRPDQPFFLYYNPLAPHRESSNTLNVDENQPGKGMLAPRYRGWWPNLVQPIGPDFNEWDMSDKPVTLKNLPPLDLDGNTWQTNDLIRADREYRRRILSVRAVDDFIRDLRIKLEQLQLQDDTVIMLTSDNGYTLGQIRSFGKGVLHDRNTRVPLIAWGPGRIVHRPEAMRHLLANIDLAPTILDLAGATAPFPMTGRSFRAILDGTYQGLFRDWRTEGVLLEHWQILRSDNRDMVLTETGIRMFDSLYVEWADGEKEYYDLRLDPLQLENSVDQLAGWEQEQFQNLITFHRLNLSVPVSHLEFPFGAEDVALQKARITGTAEYGTAIREVRVVIRDATNGVPGAFWNGTGWQTSFVSMRANLAAEGLGLVNWWYDFEPPSTGGRNRYVVTSRAYGTDGTFQPTPDSSTLWLENNQPFGQIFAPANNSTVRKFALFPVPVSGWARDDAGVRSVRLVLRDVASGRYWNGSAWQNEAVTLPVQVRPVGPLPAREVQWSYAFDPPEARGTVVCNLRIVSENQSRPVKVVSSRFSWTN